ncbi:glycosyltransferase family 2 protein [Arenimonas sp.]|uniref:glycosyltransferase family 2 protein n=1 Tax=Arenimonas sp. TaxID=1872635 RepID=UPI0039E305AE
MRISILTATYRCEDTIADCLASIAQQTHPDIEHLVIDGGSPDGTLRILEQHRTRISQLISERDDGLYDALNKGLALCTGEVVGVLHADDLYADARVLERIAHMFEDPSVMACYGDLLYVRRQDTDRVVRYWRAGEFAKAKLRRGWMPPHPAFFARRSLYQRFGGFDTGFRIAADYESLLRMLTSLEGRVAYLPEVLVRMRLGGTSNRSLGQIIRKSREDYRAIRRHRQGGIGTLLWKNLSKLGQFVGHPNPKNAAK